MGRKAAMIGTFVAEVKKEMDRILSIINPNAVQVMKIKSNWFRRIFKLVAIANNTRPTRKKLLYFAKYATPALRKLRNTQAFV